MPRDAGLEELVHAALGSLPGLSDKAMFGGWAFLLHGNLLCGARQGSLMLRVGIVSEVWALEIPGVVSYVKGGRRMPGYVRVAPEAYGDDEIRGRLLDAAVSFARSLPPK